MAQADIAGLEGLPEPQAAADPLRRGTITFGVTAAAIVLLVGTGSAVLHKTLVSLQGAALRQDGMLNVILLLNIALVLLGWQRYRQLNQEIGDRRTAEAKAQLLAEIDPLTGFLNRRSLDEATVDFFAECAQRREAAAFLLIDIDNFKTINDFHGHAAGDAVLRESARRIAAELPDRSLTARLGGDEFACLVPFDPARSGLVDASVARLMKRIAEPMQDSGLSLETTVSIGISRSDFDFGDDDPQGLAHRLMKSADVAMYHAKKQGRNRYAWFEAPMESEQRFRRELEAGIRSGIRLGEFVPYYEQQIDLSTGKLRGFEMLARWKSPEFGLVSPEVFIPIAEEIGLIADLSAGLIAQALQDAKAWNPELSLSVNISPLQLRDPWFAQKLLKTLVEANFPPQRLEIEITESCIHENIAAVRTLLSSLKNQGIRISLDDFGTGYSSLAQLRSLPFDRIKIDRSFVTNMADCKENETIVRSIASLGEGLGLPVSIEGVETEEVLERLRSQGDFLGQGYLYGRPEPADETVKRLAGLDLLAPDDTTAQTAAAQTATQGGPRRRKAAGG